MCLLKEKEREDLFTEREGKRRFVLLKEKEREDLFY